MIDFNYELEFTLDDEAVYASWLTKVIESENKKLGEINYIFCDDEYLLVINVEYLNHDTLTDIISFDYSLGNELNGDIFISIERVREQAIEYGHSFKRELSYMVVHSFYHLMGYDHIEEKDKLEMRPKEEKILEILDIKRS